VWFEDNGEQLGTMQEFFQDHASIFKGDGGGGAAQGGGQNGGHAGQ
jgi:hypothetical protein